MIVELKFGTTSHQLNHFKARAIVGRDDEGSELWAADGQISRRHAEVWLDGDTLYIRDLGSANGTWVNGQALGAVAVAIEPGHTVFVGHTPLGVEWPARGVQARTNTAPITAALAATMAARAQQQQAAVPAQPAYAYAPAQGLTPAQQAYAQQQQAYAQQQQAYAQQQQAYAQQQQAHTQQQPIADSPAAFAAAQAAAAAGVGVAATVGVGGAATPMPAELTYRRQGGNNNGTLLIALPGDTFANESTLDGFLEYTATDSETVASVIIELIEVHQRGHKSGHVWDRCLVRQGPWKTKKNDVLPMPFRLRVPSGTSASSPVCHWQLRAYVDIKWARDIEATAPITMRNTDIEKMRDALGTLDYRIAELEAEPLGQKYRGKFNPPMHLRQKLNITDINLDIEYMGTNVKVMMEVEKSKLFSFDKRQEFTFALDRLRAASVQDLAQHWQTEINKLMS
ncbi:FHA domain-containing protein [Enhygromyxa salina]|uniref:FHA domain protein n=1 Tax=Enhygromyxa salina TaxID=215803 RepID=A0A2S9XQH7_9BACT|nr:FHA domain-containing protein [Enhygromyxa salina]PRP95112.1 FHA domain protein [Enhygromyxa salina]